MFKAGQKVYRWKNRNVSEKVYLQRLSQHLAQVRKSSKEGSKVENPSVVEEMRVEDTSVVEEMRAEGTSVVEEMRAEGTSVVEGMRVENTSVVEGMKVENIPIVEGIKVENLPVVEENEDESTSVVKDIKAENTSVVQEIKVENTSLVEENEEENTSVVEEIKDENTSVVEHTLQYIAPQVVIEDEIGGNVTITPKAKDFVKSSPPRGKDDPDCRRIVELAHLANEMWCCSCKEALSFRFITSETRRGLGSILNVRCHKCLLINQVTTGKQHASPNGRIDRFDVNSEVAMGLLHYGMGHSHLNKVLACANIPTVHFNTYKRYENEAGSTMEGVAESSCLKAAVDERHVTKELE